MRGDATEQDRFARYRSGKGRMMDKIQIEMFPYEVQKILKEDVMTGYYREFLLPSVETESLQLAVDTLMMADSSRQYEGLRKSLIRREIRSRKTRKINCGSSIMQEWDEVTAEIREKVRKGCVRVW